MKKNLLYFLTLITVLTYSCRDDIATPIPLQSIEVTPDRIELGIGGTQFLKITPLPQNADTKEMPFQLSSTNLEVATVSQTGMVKGVSVGEAEIIVSAKISTEIKEIIAVTVIDKRIHLTGITVTPETISIEVGHSKQLTAKPEPANAEGFNFEWESADENIATVNSKGVITAKSKGTTTISVKSGSITKEVPVTVTQPLRIQIGSTNYLVDTLDYQVINEGISFFKFSIPEFINGFGSLGKGLVVHSLEVSLTHPDPKIEVWAAKMNGSDNRETPLNVFHRLTNEIAASGREPVAVTNGDFYVLDQHISPADYGYLRQRPHGMEATNGMLIQTPFTDILGHTHVEALIFGDDGLPDYVPNISFKGSVKTESSSFPLSEVNSFAKRGELVLFNNMAYSFGPDSALAWSPYVSTMVSLSHPEGGWRVNAPMKFRVTKIEENIKTEIPPKTPYGGKRFNGEGAILLGNPTSPGLNNGSEKFLSTLSVGDEIEIITEVKVNGNSINDKKLNIIGLDPRGAMLKNGVEYNTWNEAHPRTAFGYTKNRDKAYILVIDGRQANYSVGVTTGHIAAIMKALGAHTALNLDGGGSSAMILNGVTVNKPSDNPQRPVANGLVVITKK